MKSQFIELTRKVCEAWAGDHPKILLNLNHIIKFETVEIRTGICTCVKTLDENFYVKESINQIQKRLNNLL
jgi:hypothetical protein